MYFIYFILFYFILFYFTSLYVFILFCYLFIILFRYRYVRLDGQSTLESRRDVVQNFQTNYEIFVFLLSTRAGGVGINLTAADTVIFL
jgi:DNA helicase INO80